MLVKFKIPVRYPRQADIQFRSLEEYFATRYKHLGDISISMILLSWEWIRFHRNKHYGI